MRHSIKTKIMQVMGILYATMFVLLLGTTALGVFHMRQITIKHGKDLGVAAALDGERSLAALAQDMLLELTNSRARLADEKFHAILNQTQMVAASASDIYTNPHRYLPTHIEYLKEAEVGTPTPHLRTAARNPLHEINAEVVRAANIVPVLRLFLLNEHSGIQASYIAGATGYMIMVVRNAQMPNETRFDPATREWYQAAVKAGGPVWIEYQSAERKGPVISCAAPFYKEGPDGKRVLAGVANTAASLTSSIELLIDANHLGKTGYAFVLDDRGNVILSNHPIIEGMNFLKDPEPTIVSLSRAMVSGETGMQTLSIAGEEVYVSFCPLKTVNWSFAAVVKVKEVLASAEAVSSDIITLTNTNLHSISKDLYIMFAVSLILTTLIMVGGVLMTNKMSRAVTEPLARLAAGARFIGAGHLDKRIDIRTGDEFEEVGRAFTTMADDLRHYIADITRITAEREQERSELALASTIQRSMLPSVFPAFAGRPEFTIAGKMTPARDVGGDFYDFFSKRSETTADDSIEASVSADKRLALVIADVSGKGIAAALFMSITKITLKRLLLDTGDPAAALEGLNAMLQTENPLDMFVTAFAGILDLETGEFVYANGGHNPPLFAQAGGEYEFMRLKRGVPPGMLEGQQYSRCSMRFEPGAKLYLYTDGLSEAMNPAGELFGNDRLKDACNAARSLPPQTFDESVRSIIAKFCTGAEQSDDMTTVALLYNGPSG
jgi:sigma-B regulation protein RsbU (phosphoserine phosphatase)